MGKPIYWVSLAQWSRMTPAEYKSLDDYCDQVGVELGIDVAGWHTDEYQLDRDFQKDKDEDLQSGGGPGA